MEGAMRFKRSCASGAVLVQDAETQMVPIT